MPIHQTARTFGARRVPATTAASGCWQLGEVTQARRAGIWPSVGDPFFTDVAILLHMDGANGGTTFTDSGPDTLAATVVGDAQTSTAQSKFGGASAVFDGAGDYISFPGLGLSTNAFTVEFWLRTTDSLQYRALAGNQTSTLGVWQILLNSDAANDGTIGFWVRGIAGAVATTSGGYNDGSWHHFAAVRSGTTLELFVDGASEATATNSSDLSSAQNFNVGLQPGAGRAYTGYIDELRVTKAARYTAAFTPQTAAFPDE